MVTSVLFNHQVHVGPVDLHTLRLCVIAKGHGPAWPPLWNWLCPAENQHSSCCLSALKQFAHKFLWKQCRREDTNVSAHKTRTCCLSPGSHGRTLLCQWSEVVFTWVLTISYICFRSLGKNIQSFHLHKYKSWIISWVLFLVSPLRNQAGIPHVAEF